MIDSRKRSSVGFWLAVVFAGTAFYVLSTGPAAWISSKGYVAAEVGAAVYAPLGWIMEYAPEPVVDVSLKWFSLWVPEWEEQLKERLGKAMIEAVGNSMASEFSDVHVDGGTTDDEMPREEVAGVEYRLPTADGAVVVRVCDRDAEVIVYNEEGKIEVTPGGSTERITFSFDPANRNMQVRKGTVTLSGARCEFWPKTDHAVTARFVRSGDIPQVAADDGTETVFPRDK